MNDEGIVINSFLLYTNYEKSIMNAVRDIDTLSA